MYLSQMKVSSDKVIFFVFILFNRHHQILVEAVLEVI